MKSSIFYRKVLAKIKGDDAEFKALTIFQKSKGLLELEVAKLVYEVSQAKNAVAEAQVKYDDSLFPKEVPEKDAYVAKINAAYDVLEAEKETFEDLEYSLQYYKEIIADKFAEIQGQ